MGKARSINYEDVTRLLEYTGPVGQYYSTDGTTKYLTERKTIGELVAGGETALSYTSTPDGSSINNYYVDYIHIGKTNENIVAEDVTKNLVYQGTYYWLASSCVDVYFNKGYANFHIRTVPKDTVGTYFMTSTKEESNFVAYSLRPVVVLASNLQVSYNGTTVTLSK